MRQEELEPLPIRLSSAQKPNKKKTFTNRITTTFYFLILLPLRVCHPLPAIGRQKTVGGEGDELRFLRGCDIEPRRDGWCAAHAIQYGRHDKPKIKSMINIKKKKKKKDLLLLISIFLTGSFQ